MKLGIGTYCYMWAIGFKFGDKEARPPRPMDAFDLLHRAHELGLRLVQYGPNLPLAVLSETDLDRFVAQAQAWDIELELGTRGLETDHLASQITLHSASAPRSCARSRSSAANPWRWRTSRAA